MKPKVLLVDDEPDTLALLDYVLCAAGFDVATATNGAEALDLARHVRPDVVLLDIKLPDVDGFAVCELLHAQCATATTPVILFSSLSGISVQAHALEAGSRHCLNKSEGLETVIRSLWQAMSEHGTAAAASRNGRNHSNSTQRSTQTHAPDQLREPKGATGD